MKWSIFVSALMSGATALNPPPLAPLALRAEAPGCPSDLSGPFEFPHLIIPVNASQPDSAPGTSYFGAVSKDVSSLFQFDIPNRVNQTQCTLFFMFPDTRHVPSSSYILRGAGQVRFGLLEGVISHGTTYNNKPAVRADYGVHSLVPGSTSVIANIPCALGQTMAVQMSAVGETELSYFQDYGRHQEFGLFMTMCSALVARRRILRP